jgi:hypothetical protein
MLGSTPAFVVVKAASFVVIAVPFYSASLECRMRISKVLCVFKEKKKGVFCFVPIANRQHPTVSNQLPTPISGAGTYNSQ